MSPEEIIAEMQEMQKELESDRVAAWKKAEDAIKKTLDDKNFPMSPAVRAIYLDVFKIVWHKGYYAGSMDVSVRMAKELGLGYLIDTMKITEQQIKSKPENN